MPVKVTVWSENYHEPREDGRAPALSGRHSRRDRRRPDRAARRPRRVRTAMLEDPEHGLSEKDLADDRRADLVGAHGPRGGVDEVVERVHQRVLAGMGLLVLHSGHYSKIFRG